MIKMKTLKQTLEANYQNPALIKDILIDVRGWLTQKRQFYKKKLQDLTWIETATPEEYNTVWDRNNEIKELLEELKQ